MSDTRAIQQQRESEDPVMFRTNRHGQKVYVATIEQLAQITGLSIDSLAAMFRTYEANREPCRWPDEDSNFPFIALREQDTIDSPVRLKCDVPWYEE